MNSIYSVSQHEIEAHEAAMQAVKEKECMREISRDKK